MNRSYQLIIFDWDGTLMDTASEFIGAFQQIIQDTGLPERTPAQMRELVGLGVRDVLARLFPGTDPANLFERIRRYRRRYGWPRAQPRLFEGTYESLRVLKEQGFTLAVATGKSRRGLERAMNATDCRDLFHITRCADESAPKPAPNMINDILLRTATEPEACLMVGDTEYDIAMSRASGIDALGICRGVHNEVQLRRSGAIAIIEDIRALPAWLGCADCNHDPAIK